MSFKKISFRILTLILTVLALSVCVCASEVEVSTVEDFEKAMQSDGDADIVVTDDIIYTCRVKEEGSYWISMGQGKKTLNLSGHSVELNAEHGSEITMIFVPKGAELVINDTSGDNSGKLFCYGKMETPRTDRGPRYFNDTVKYRNVLEIDGGTVTIDGGTLEAGRSKKQWIYDGRDVYDLRHMLDYTIQFGVLGLAIGARFDGYAWQQVNGDCITVNDGTLLVNDGVFLGRGFSHLETFVKENDNDVDVEFSRSACLRLLGGTAIINGGTFHGKGNADVFAVKKDVKVMVKSGTFSTNHLRVLLVPTINVTLMGYWEPYVIGHAQRYGYKYHPASDVGSVRLSSDMLDPQRNTVEYNGEILPVSEWTKLNATGNDGSATVEITHHMSNSDRRNFMSGNRTAGKKEIKNLNISGTNAYGMTLSPDILSCNEEGVREISVEWYHNDELCDDQTTMVAGKYYAKVTVVLDRDYVFSESPNFSIMGDKVSSYELAATKRRAVLMSKVYDLECNHSYNEDEYIHFDNDRHFMRCSVCEEVLLDEEHDFHDGEKVDGSIVYECRVCDFSYSEADDGKIRIDYLNINLPNPKPGFFPEYYGLISGEGVSFADGGDEFTKNGVRWGLYVNDYGVAEDVPFASGMGYRATVYLKADEGYTFRKDQNAKYNPVVIVNGEEAEYETDGTLMTVKYVVNTSEITASYIDILGIDFPEVGNTADRKAESADPQYYACKSISWYEDGEYMDYGDTFKEGKEYTVEMYIDTVRSGWDYTAKFGSDLYATVDGFAVDGKNIERFHDTSIKVTFTFPALGKYASFLDVDSSAYYYEAVNWAYENGVTSGTSAYTFGPDENCTRGQVVTFLWRAAGCPEPQSTYNPFGDVKTDDYFYKAVHWAVERGITTGTSANTFSPEVSCSSAHIITFLYRAMGIGTDGWYEEARNWAISEGLLDITGITVAENELCPRGAVVTFIYRIYK